jgi:hypothetical protein
LPASLESQNHIFNFLSFLLQPAAKARGTMGKWNFRVRNRTPNIASPSCKKFSAAGHICSIFFNSADAFTTLQKSSNMLPHIIIGDQVGGV